VLAGQGCGADAEAEGALERVTVDRRDGVPLDLVWGAAEPRFRPQDQLARVPAADEARRYLLAAFRVAEAGAAERLVERPVKVSVIAVGPASSRSPG
jgi:hypothetical protein